MSKNFLGTIIVFLVVLFTVLFVYQKINVPETSSYNIQDAESVSNDTINTQDKNLSRETVEEIIDNKMLYHIKNLRDELVQELQKMKEKNSDSNDSQEPNMQNKTENYKIDTPFIGNANGKIKMDYFYDYTCVYCRNAYTALRKIANDRKDVQIFLRPIYLEKNYKKHLAQNALAVYAVHPEKFFEFHDYLINSKVNFNDINLADLFNQYKLEKSKIDQLLSKDLIENLLQKNIDLISSLSIDGVPAYKINDKVHREGALSYNELNKELDKYK